MSDQQVDTAAPVSIVESLTTAAANQNTDPSAQYHLTNLGVHAIAVPIIHVVTGQRHEVFVQPGGKPRLEPGYRVDPVFAARNPHLGAALVSQQ